ncbi:retrovirus-related Pol polyprotein from transposon TNT 1-94 [Trifolium medium]|uniref:Retrovirus-related Pol polyprotein from transposon TNT 1-94 n=1 Tax=Trifolium medium TaxID=97028 RepID=A0A392LY13_9FABA|nr:retrovirus-related Pol polyprotein from transposon TNT 1-94 [Trifolium medium]
MVINLKVVVTNFLVDDQIPQFTLKVEVLVARNLHMAERGGAVNNCHNNGNEEDSKSVAAYEEDNEDLNSGRLYFTPDQHKALLALLQNSANMQSHSRMIGVAELNHGLYTLNTKHTSPADLSDKQASKFKFPISTVNSLDSTKTDNGNEFKLLDFFSETGIFHQCSCVGTPQQNGIVERKHQHLLGTARALLFQSHLPKTFWDYAISHAVHIINRLHTPFLTNKSPYQVVYNELPDISTLKFFGSLCYAATLSAHRKKLDSRSRKCLNLGFKFGVKGHVLFDLKTREIFVSRDVIFFEHIFPFQNSQDNVVKSHTSHSQTYLLDDPFNDCHYPTLDSLNQTNLSSTPAVSNSLPNDTLHNLPNQHSNHSTPPLDSQHLTSHTDNAAHNSPSPNLSISPSLPHNTPSQHINQPVPIRKSNRITQPPPYLTKNYYCNNLTSVAVHDSPKDTPSSSSPCKYPISSYISYQHLSSAHHHYISNITTISEPTCYEKAVCDPNWKAAIKVELTALDKYNTWKLVPLPKHKHAIGCKWVFKLKLHSNGTIERYKARLVAKGYTQTEGIDYLDTFSHVVKMTTIRMFLAIAAIQNWPLYQLDVNTAFLHGDLNEEVYMKPPSGLDLPSDNLVCKLL